MPLEKLERNHDEILKLIEWMFNFEGIFCKFGEITDLLLLYLTVSFNLYE